MRTCNYDVAVTALSFKCCHFADGLRPGEKRKPVSVSIKEPTNKRRGRHADKHDELDPMDPAAYSEVSFLNVLYP